MNFLCSGHPLRVGHRSAGASFFARVGGSVRMLLGSLAALSGAAWAHEPVVWTLVQPMVRTPTNEALIQHYLKLLPQYLDARVHLSSSQLAKGDEALRWAMETAPPKHTLILMSGIWMHRTERRWPGSWDTVPLVTLQTVFQAPLCLLVPQDRRLPDSRALEQWLASLKRPVRLGLPDPPGPPGLWMQAMERKTGLIWKGFPFRQAIDGVQALAAGKVDMVLARCSDVRQQWQAHAGGEHGRPLPVQVLLSVGSSPWMVPSFASWKLPPLEQGWAAWFAPAAMPVEQQEAAARALHAITLRSDTVVLVRSLHLSPSRLDWAASRQYVYRSRHNTRSLELWLQQLHPNTELVTAP